jgi:hypothetical protein
VNAWQHRQVFKKLGPEERLHWVNALHEIDDTDRLSTNFFFIAFQHEIERSQLESELAADPSRDKAEARNRLDLDFCARYVLILSMQLTPHHPAAALLHHLENALADTLAGTKPPLLFEIEIERKDGAGDAGNARGRKSAALGQGQAALIFDMLLKGGLSKSEAISWVTRECAELRIVDEADKPLTGRQVAGWRDEFSRGQGSRGGRVSYNGGIKGWLNTHEEAFEPDTIAVLRSPTSDRKKTKGRSDSAVDVAGVQTLLQPPAAEPKEVLKQQIAYKLKNRKNPSYFRSGGR